MDKSFLVFIRKWFLEAKKTWKLYDIKQTSRHACSKLLGNLDFITSLVLEMIILFMLLLETWMCIFHFSKTFKSIWQKDVNFILNKVKIINIFSIFMMLLREYLPHAWILKNNYLTLCFSLCKSSYFESSTKC